MTHARDSVAASYDDLSACLQYYSTVAIAKSSAGQRISCSANVGTSTWRLTRRKASDMVDMMELPLAVTSTSCPQELPSEGENRAAFVAEHVAEKATAQCQLHASLWRAHVEYVAEIYSRPGGRRSLSFSSWVSTLLCPVGEGQESSTRSDVVGSLIASATQ